MPGRFGGLFSDKEVLCYIKALIFYRGSPELFVHVGICSLNKFWFESFHIAYVFFSFDCVELSLILVRISSLRLTFLNVKTLNRK